jgi:hypothetical protein
MPSTINRRLSTLSSFYKYCQLEDILDKNTAIDVRRPKVHDESKTLGLDAMVATSLDVSSVLIGIVIGRGACVYLPRHAGVLVARDCAHECQTAVRHVEVDLDGLPRSKVEGFSAREGEVVHDGTVVDELPGVGARISHEFMGGELELGRSQHHRIAWLQHGSARVLVEEGRLSTGSVRPVGATSSQPTDEKRRRGNHCEPA